MTAGRPRGLSPGYRWTCPICGAARVTKYTGEEEQRATFARAKRALEAHVHSSVGDGHGSKHSFPGGADAETLATQIESVTE